MKFQAKWHTNVLVKRRLREAPILGEEKDIQSLAELSQLLNSLQVLQRLPHHPYYPGLGLRGDPLQLPHARRAIRVTVPSTGSITMKSG